MDGRQEYSNFREEIYKRELSNAENFDKAILTYASGALAVSLTFLKDFVPIYKANSVWLLYSSWGFFSTCIASTVASYLFSQWGIKQQLRCAREYYLENKQEALNRKNTPASITEYLNIASGVLFCTAIFMTTIFIGINAKEASMSEKTKLVEAAPIPAINRLINTGDGSEKKAIPIPEITPLPATSAPAPSTTTQTQPAQTQTKPASD